MFITAYNIRDLENAVDYRTSERYLGCASNFTGKDFKEGKFDFVTRCPNSKTSWYQKIAFTDWDLVKTSVNVVEVKEDVENSEEIEEDKNFQQEPVEFKIELNELDVYDVKVNCTCPAFKYFYRYILHQLDTSIESEDRYPHITNPGLDGTVCKHILSVFRTFFLL